MMNTRPLLIGLAVAAACIAAPAARANLLSNPSFEAVVVGVNNSCDGTYPWCIRSPESTPGWLQTGDGVDLIHNEYTRTTPSPTRREAPG